MGALLLSSTSSAAEWSMHGAIKNETAYFISGEQRFDKIQNRIDVKPEARLSERWEFRGRVLSWYDAAMDVESTNTTDLTPTIKQHYRTYADIKEAYLLYGGDDFDLRLGQQQVVWGKTDGLRLLDIVNPLNMQEFMLDDFLDSRMGVMAARLNYYAYLGDSEHEFEFLLLPEPKVAELAPAGSRWSYAAPAFPAGVTPVLMPAEKPGGSAAQAEYGMAWRANMAGWDLSLNWFYGWKDMPNMQKNKSGTIMEVTPVYSQMHTLGGSFSNAFGAVVLRGELAVNVDESISRQGVTPATSIGTDTTWNMAFGMDYNQNNWLLSPQLFVRYLPSWDAGAAEDEVSSFVSVLIATDFLNEKLKSEMMTLFNWGDDSWMLRPKVSYAFTDQIAAKLGLDLFVGSTGFFGQFDANDRVYTEIEYTF